MILSTDDRLAIHELLARIDHAVDAQDWDGYLHHFTEDATLDPGFAEPARGRDGIRAFLVATEGGTKGKRHVATNLFCDPQEDGSVLARSYLTVIEREGSPRVVATAYIEDSVVRAGDGWKVARHVVKVDPGMFAAQQEPA